MPHICSEDGRICEGYIMHGSLCISQIEWRKDHKENLWYLQNLKGKSGEVELKRVMSMIEKMPLLQAGWATNWKVIFTTLIYLVICHFDHFPLKNVYFTNHCAFRPTELGKWSVSHLYYILVTLWKRYRKTSVTKYDRFTLQNLPEFYFGVNLPLNKNHQETTVSMGWMGLMGWGALQRILTDRL